MMRVLANENIPQVAVAALRSAGHDVSWVSEDAPSTADADVLAHASAEARVLVTMDKDFGELAFRAGLPAHCGIVLVRIPPLPSRVAEVLVRELGGDADFAGKFVVIEAAGLRVRPLP
jgi:predicted nuclease of predicted toxin-antitoxin system